MQENRSDNLGAFRAALAGTQRSGGRSGAVGLVLLCLVVYLPGLFALPPVDRDEARFAQASRQMFESVSLPILQRDPVRHGGGLVVPMVQDRPRLNKPPLIYWVQSASAALLSGGNPYRDSIWMYRVPSLIAAIAAVLMTRKLGSAMFHRAAGNLAAIFLAVCPLIAWEARQARADMVLLAWTMLAMLQLWRMFSRDLSHHLGSEGASPIEGSGQSTLKSAILFWVAVGGGILTKGPITPLITGMTALGLCVGSRRWRWLLELKPWLGLPIVALMVGPWVYAVARHVGFDEYWDTIFRETVGRSTEAAEGHWGPPGYHLAFMLLLLWPGSLLTGEGLVLAVRLGLKRRAVDAPAAGASLQERVRQTTAAAVGHPSYLFLVAWIVPGWLLFEFISTKLPHYTMPMYPALAILSARSILAADAKALPAIETRPTRAGFVLWLVLGAGIVFGSLAALVTRIVVSPGSIGGVIGLILVGLIGAAVMFQGLGSSWRAVRMRRFARAAVAGAMVLVVMWLIVPTFALPRLMGLTGAIGKELNRIDPGASRPVAAVGYHEDSLVFFTRGKLERLDDGTAAAWLAQHPQGLLIRDRQSVIAGESAWREIGAAEGFNYSRGRSQRIAIEEAPP